MIYRAELKGRDLLEIDSSQTPAKLKVVGCSELLTLVRGLRDQHGKDPLAWPMPNGNSHGELLLREVLLKAKNQWAYPYCHEEICHCRTVATEDVDQAIIAGAHTSDRVSQQTGASRACGTCRTDVEKIIDFRIQKAS